MKKNNLYFLYRSAILLVVLCLLCASCISLGGLYCGYNQLSDEQKQQVKVLETFIENIVADGNIYLVTHEQVAAFIKTHEDVLIYEYTPWCSAENCANPHEVAKLCKERGSAFLLISTTLEDFSDLLKLKLPTFAINHHARLESEGVHHPDRRGTHDSHRHHEPPLTRYVFSSNGSKITHFIGDFSFIVRRTARGCAMRRLYEENE